MLTLSKKRCYTDVDEIVNAKDMVLIQLILSQKNGTIVSCKRRKKHEF